MPQRYNQTQRLALALLPPLGALLIRLLGATLRVREIGVEAHADRHPETRVYCLWHRSLLAIAWHFRKRNIAILISPSFDGELIARTIVRLGYTAIRGSSTRGGASGLIGMRRALEEERVSYAAFTADGPRGPRFHAKPGGVKLAQQTGGGVGIFYAAPRRAWQLGSWDRFLIPMPFSTVILGWHPPVPVPATLHDESLEAARVQVEQALEATRRSVEQAIADR